jgi:hypothetical protein
VAGKLQGKNPHRRLIYGRIILKCCNGFDRSIARQQLGKHVPVNKQQWELCSLWAMLQLVARLQTILTIEECVFCVGRAVPIYNEIPRITEAEKRPGVRAGILKLMKIRLRGPTFLAIVDRLSPTLH